MEIDENLLVDFLEERLDEEGCRRVEEWCESSPENRKLLEQLYYTLFVGNRVVAEQNVNTDLALEGLKSEINNHQIQSQKRTPEKKFWKKAFIAAAVFTGIILAGATVWLYSILDKYTSDFEIRTGIGEKAKVILPDGTKVWLNACSEIKYNIAPFSKERKVDLIGEAYFEVTKNKDLPFIVSSKNINTRVLGTKFNIQANKNGKDVIATLLEGSISITSPLIGGEGIKMKPLQQLTVNVESGKVLLKNCSESVKYIQWINGKLYFNQATLEEITMELTRNYDVNFIFADETLKNERFTASFSLADDIFQILYVLHLTKKFKYEVNDRQVIFTAIK